MSSSPLAGADLFDGLRSMSSTSDKVMRESGQKAGTNGRKDARTRAERVATFLRRCHPTKTAVNVEADTGIPAATVRKWLEQGQMPKGEVLLELIDHYGAELLHEAFGAHARPWIADAARRAEQERLERHLAETRGKLDALWSRA